MSVKARWAVRWFVIPFSVISLLLAALLVTNVRQEYWLAALIWTAITLGAFFVLGLVFKWFPNTPNDEEFEQYLRTGDRAHIHFCEGYESGWVRQPVGTWSDLPFIAGGLLVILLAGIQPQPAPNPMADSSSLIPLVYGLAVIFMGPGSMLFHASMKAWAAWFDNMSIIFWAAFSMSYTLIRLLGAWFGLGLDWLWVVFGLVVIAVGVSTFKSEPIRRTSQVIVIGAWLLIELVFAVAIWFGIAPGLLRDTNWFLGALIFYMLAFACWIPAGGIFRTWCEPEAPLQGHGLWHLFTAIGTVLVFMYFLSEYRLAA